MIPSDFPIIISSSIGSRVPSSSMSPSSLVSGIPSHFPSSSTVPSEMASYIPSEQPSGSNTWPLVMPSELPSYEFGGSGYVSPSDIPSNATSEAMLSSTSPSSIQSSGPSIMGSDVPVSDGNDIPSESLLVLGAPSGADDSRLPSISVSTNTNYGFSILTNPGFVPLAECDTF